MSAAEGDTRVALVTGASRGIGAAIARRLAADGMAVAINSDPSRNRVAAAEDVAATIGGAGGQVAVYAANISVESAVNAMFDQCETDLGPVDVLVLNAAATTRMAWTRISESDWDKVTAVNLKGALLCCRRAFGAMEGQCDGVIVTISSVLAQRGAPNSLHYGTTKAGIVGFTRSLARELAPRGIRVNCVMPGSIVTEDEIETFPDREAADRSVLRNQMLQRRGTPDDIAGVVSFLVGSDSGFMTGQTVCVDGGGVLL